MASESPLLAMTNRCPFVWRVQQKHVDEVIEASSRFSKDTEERIIQKMEASLKQREQQLDRLMERLQKHVCYHFTFTLLIIPYQTRVVLCDIKYT